MSLIRQRRKLPQCESDYWPGPESNAPEENQVDEKRQMGVGRDAPLGQPRPAPFLQGHVIANFL